MNWNSLTDESQLEVIKQESEEAPVLIFKHSTRCSISSMAINRLERSWNDDKNIKAYYLDLIQYRDISNLVAQEFNVQHQSPQVILVKGGEAVYTDSHMGISADRIESAAIEA